MNAPIRTLHPRQIPCDFAIDMAYEDAGDLPVTLHFRVDWDFPDLNPDARRKVANAVLYGCTIGDATLDLPTTEAVFENSRDRIAALEGLATDKAQAEGRG